MLTVIVCGLGLLVVFLISYIGYLKIQMRRMNQQLALHLDEDSSSMISVELINRELELLAANVNRCLDKEKQERVESSRHEQEFKELVSHISHDLRTPLTVVRGYQQLLEHSSLSPDQQAKLAICRRHMEESGELIDQFFEYTCLVSGQEVCDPEKLDLAALAVEYLAGMVPLFEAQELVVAADLAEPVWVLADQEMAGRIIRNLLSNSLVHSAGEIRMTAAAGEFGILTVQNPVQPGQKIEPERLFDRFYTGDPARRGSAGLGLAIVRLLTELNGGSVSACLEETNLTIEVKLPLAG